MANGITDPDDRLARDLFPHTKECSNKLRRGVMRHGGHVLCTCPAKSGRRNFLLVIKRVRTQAYADAYAKIRHEAKQRAALAKTTDERLAFENVAAWAENLELERLNTDL